MVVCIGLQEEQWVSSRQRDRVYTKLLQCTVGGQHVVGDDEQRLKRGKRIRHNPVKWDRFRQHRRAEYSCVQGVGARAAFPPGHQPRAPYSKRRIAASARSEYGRYVELVSAGGAPQERAGSVHLVGVWLACAMDEGRRWARRAPAVDIRVIVGAGGGM